MSRNDTLSDRQSEPLTAGKFIQFLTRSAGCVLTKKSLKEMGQTLFGYPHTRIANLDPCHLLIRINSHKNFSILLVVTDRIAQQIDHNLRK